MSTITYRWESYLWNLQLSRFIQQTLMFCGATTRCRADSRLAPSQWEMSLQSNAISHWLGAKLERALTLSSQTASIPCGKPLGIQDMISWHGHAFCITGPLWGESTSDLWISNNGPVIQSSLLLGRTKFSTNGRVNEWMIKFNSRRADSEVYVVHTSCVIIA